MTVRGSSKAVAMLDLWASVKRAARDRAPEDRDQAGEGEAEPQGRPGVPAARPPVHVVAE
jgi:hypothetical protein